MNETEACGCGHDHGDRACGCGHAHHEDYGHVHGPGCGCGHAEIEITPAADLSVVQQNMLLALHARRYLPVARFVMESSREAGVYAVALAPVYLGTPADTMEAVKSLGAELDALERAGLISLDYDMPLSGYPYEEYDASTLYAFFRQTVLQGSERPGAVFDRAVLDKGSMALTGSGAARVEEMLD